MCTRRASRGIALVVVLSILCICALLGLATARSTLLHEMMAGQQSDQFRALAAAEALVRDAELDILGSTAVGGPCRPQAPGIVGCRERGQGAEPQAPYFPQTVDEFEEVNAWLLAHGLTCSAGICMPQDLDTLADLPASGTTLPTTAARYGEFTRTGLAAPGAAGNPVLSGATPRAWYWAEVLRYESAPDALVPRGHLQPDPTRPFVYRITAVAHGLKPGTRAVVRSFFVPYPVAQLP